MPLHVCGYQAVLGFGGQTQYLEQGVQIQKQVQCMLHKLYVVKPSKWAVIAETSLSLVLFLPKCQSSAVSPTGDAFTPLLAQQ